MKTASGDVPSEEVLLGVLLEDVPSEEVLLGLLLEDVLLGVGKHPGA